MTPGSRSGGPEWLRSKRCPQPCDRSGGQGSGALLAVAALSAGYAGYALHRSVREHGWDGALRYLWEGDPYDPVLRAAVDRLEDAELQLRATHAIGDKLSGLEESLDAATASSASHDPSFTAGLWNTVWMDHPSNGGWGTGRDRYALGVERTLAGISDKLDKIAAAVDAVVVAPPECAGASVDSVLGRRVKQRKKALSRAIVSEMERCDALLASYQVLRERTTE